MIVPADEGFALAGEIHDDARFAPGLTVVTSPVLAVDARAGTVRTRHTAYRLGRPSPKFAGWELVRLPRLSVMPVPADLWAEIERRAAT